MVPADPHPTSEQARARQQRVGCVQLPHRGGLGDGDVVEHAEPRDHHAAGQQRLQVDTRTGGQQAGRLVNVPGQVGGDGPPQGEQHREHDTGHRAQQGRRGADGHAVGHVDGGEHHRHRPDQRHRQRVGAGQERGDHEEGEHTGGHQQAQDAQDALAPGHGDDEHEVDDRQRADRQLALVVDEGVGGAGQDGLRRVEHHEPVTGMGEPAGLTDQLDRHDQALALALGDACAHVSLGEVLLLDTVDLRQGAHGALTARQVRGGDGGLAHRAALGGEGARTDQRALARPEHEQPDDGGQHQGSDNDAEHDLDPAGLARIQVERAGGVAVSAVVASRLCLRLGKALGAERLVARGGRVGAHRPIMPAPRL